MINLSSRNPVKPDNGIILGTVFDFFITSPLAATGMVPAQIISSPEQGSPERVLAIVQHSRPGEQSYKSDPLDNPYFFELGQIIFGITQKVSVHLFIILTQQRGIF